MVWGINLKLKIKKNSLKVTVWLYLSIFSLLILIFLWLFQIISLNKFYEYSKRSEVIKAVNKIKNDYSESNLDTISNNYQVCIEVYEGIETAYISNNYGRGCSGDGNFTVNKAKINFINSDENTASYEFVNSKFRDKILTYGIKVDSNTYIFVNTSLQPVNNTIEILKDQFLIVSIIVLGLSFLIGFFISKRISRPIITINNQAKKMAKGDYNFKYAIEEDIDEINELTITLNDTLEELAKSENLRRELMANVSHDLKTPLTMIKAYAEMVRDVSYKNSKKRTENLNIIISEADRLNILVNDILDLSSLEADTKLNIEEFEINKFVENIVDTYKIYNEKYKYNIKLINCEKTMVHADRNRMDQVIRNLINNAINYTGENKEVKVVISEDNGKIKIEIKDTGEGVSKKELKYIWNKYYKADKTHSRLFLGSGIGLSIVKTILEAHHFLYDVVSIKNKGTTFYFIMN